MALSIGPPRYGYGSDDDMKGMTEREIGIMNKILFQGDLDLYHKLYKEVYTYFGWEASNKSDTIYLRRTMDSEGRPPSIMYDNINDVIEEKPKNLWELFDDIVFAEEVPYDPLVEKILCLFSDYKDEISSVIDKHFMEKK